MSGREQRKIERKGPDDALRSGESAGARPEGYTIETGDGPQLRPELVDGEARDEAERCRQVSETQMRRFFGAAKAEQLGMESGNQARVAMALLKAKAHYAAARERKNGELAGLFAHHARQIRTKDDFGHFMQHFEAVIAYHKFNQQGRR